MSDTKWTDRYDAFLGQFVDAVQSARGDFHDLRGEWLAGCPTEWRDAFSDDLAEIESLLDAGAFAGAEA